MKRYRILLALLALLALGLGLLPYGLAQPSPMPTQGGRSLHFPLVWRNAAKYPVTTLVSVSSNSAQGNGPSYWASISGDGRYVAFESGASNLVAGDSNNANDVFVHDRLTGQTTRVSVSSDGIQGNGWSVTPSISRDGRYVAFVSDASNLVAGDTNIYCPPVGNYYNCSDVFVHDRQTGETTRVSVSSAGAQANSWSSLPSISGDGRYVAFLSEASNLVAGGTAWVRDIFVHDRLTGQTTSVSVSSDGTRANSSSISLSISADGRYVAFESAASNLVAGDTSGVDDVFVHDRQTQHTTRVSVALDGTQANGESFHPSISADGRYVAFYSFASNLVPGDTSGSLGVFVHDRQMGQTTRVGVSSAGGWAVYPSSHPVITDDGRYVAFDLLSGQEPWVPNLEGDIFVYDRITGQTTRASVSSTGAQSNGVSYAPSISADGRYVAFYSFASNLVPGDTNGTWDVFLHQRW